MLQTNSKIGMRLINNIFVVVVVVLSFNSIKAQQVKFQISFLTTGATEGYYLQEILNGPESPEPGYIIITNNYALIRTDLEGTILWSKKYSFPYGGFSDYVQQTNDYGFLIAGSVVDSLGNKNYNLVKTDFNGAILWSKQYAPQGDDSLFDSVFYIDNHLGFDYYGKIGVKARQTEDNGFVILGQIYSTVNNITHFQLIKTDSLGLMQWTNYYDENIYSDSNTTMISHIYDIDNVERSSSKGFVLLGQIIDTSNNLMDNFIQVIRVDSSGTILWSKKYMSSIYDHICVSIKETNDKGYIIVGSIEGQQNPIIFKLDSSGVVQWSKMYSRECNTDDQLGSNSVKQTYDGGYLIGCYHSHSDIPLEAVLIKVDTLGNLQWSMAYQHWGQYSGMKSEAFNVIQCLDSGYAFCGYRYNDEVYFVKTDANGYSGCMDSLFSLCQYNFSLQVTSLGNILNVTVSNPAIVPLVQIPVVNENTFCFTVGINEISQINNSISIYPNPATTLLNIHHSTCTSQETLLITDLLGTVVYKEELHGISTTISISTWSAGIYFYEVRTEKESTRGKFVVQK